MMDEFDDIREEFGIGFPGGGDGGDGFDDIRAEFGVGSPGPARTSTSSFLNTGNKPFAVDPKEWDREKARTYYRPGVRPALPEIVPSKLKQLGLGAFAGLARVVPGAMSGLENQAYKELEGDPRLEPRAIRPAPGTPDFAPRSGASMIGVPGVESATPEQRLESERGMRRSQLARDLARSRFSRLEQAVSGESGTIPSKLGHTAGYLGGLAPALAAGGAALPARLPAALRAGTAFAGAEAVVPEVIETMGGPEALGTPGERAAHAFAAGVSGVGLGKLGKMISPNIIRAPGRLAAHARSGLEHGMTGLGFGAMSGDPEQAAADAILFGMLGLRSPSSARPAAREPTVPSWARQERPVSREPGMAPEQVAARARPEAHPDPVTEKVMDVPEQVGMRTGGTRHTDALRQRAESGDVDAAVALAERMENKGRSQQADKALELGERIEATGKAREARGFEVRDLGPGRVEVTWDGPGGTRMRSEGSRTEMERVVPKSLRHLLYPAEMPVERRSFEEGKRPAAILGPPKGSVPTANERAFRGLSEEARMRGAEEVETSRGRVQYWPDKAAEQIKKDHPELAKAPVEDALRELADRDALGGVMGYGEGNATKGDRAYFTGYDKGGEQGITIAAKNSKSARSALWKMGYRDIRKTTPEGVIAERLAGERDAYSKEKVGDIAYQGTDPSVRERLLDVREQRSSGGEAYPTEMHSGLYPPEAFRSAIKKGSKAAHEIVNDFVRKRGYGNDYRDIQKYKKMFATEVKITEDEADALLRLADEYVPTDVDSPRARYDKIYREEMLERATISPDRWKAGWVTKDGDILRLPEAGEFSHAPMAKRIFGKEWPDAVRADWEGGNLNLEVKSLADITPAVRRALRDYMETSGTRKFGVKVDVSPNRLNEPTESYSVRDQIAMRGDPVEAFLKHGIGTLEQKWARESPPGEMHSGLYPPEKLRKGVADTVKRTLTDPTAQAEHDYATRMRARGKLSEFLYGAGRVFGPKGAAAARAITKGLSLPPADRALREEVMRHERVVYDIQRDRNRIGQFLAGLSEEGQKQFWRNADSYAHVAKGHPHYGALKAYNRYVDKTGKAFVEVGETYRNNVQELLTVTERLEKQGALLTPEGKNRLKELHEVARKLGVAKALDEDTRLKYRKPNELGYTHRQKPRKDLTQKERKGLRSWGERFARWNLDPSVRESDLAQMARETGEGMAKILSRRKQLSTAEAEAKGYLTGMLPIMRTLSMQGRAYANLALMKRIREASSKDNVLWREPGLERDPNWIMADDPGFGALAGKEIRADVYGHVDTIVRPARSGMWDFLKFLSEREKENVTIFDTPRYPGKQFFIENPLNAMNAGLSPEYIPKRLAQAGRELVDWSTGRKAPREELQLILDAGLDKGYWHTEIMGNAERIKYQDMPSVLSGEYHKELWKRYGQDRADKKNRADVGVKSGGSSFWWHATAEARAASEAVGALIPLPSGKTKRIGAADAARQIASGSDLLWQLATAIHLKEMGPAGIIHKGIQKARGKSLRGMTDEAILRELRMGWDPNYTGKIVSDISAVPIAFAFVKWPIKQLTNIAPSTIGGGGRWKSRPLSTALIVATGSTITEAFLSVTGISEEDELEIRRQVTAGDPERMRTSAPISVSRDDDGNITHINYISTSAVDAVEFIRETLDPRTRVETSPGHSDLDQWVRGMASSHPLASRLYEMLADRDVYTGGDVRDTSLTEDVVEAAGRHVPGMGFFRRNISKGRKDAREARFGEPTTPDSLHALRQVGFPFSRGYSEDTPEGRVQKGFRKWLEGKKREVEFGEKGGDFRRVPKRPRPGDENFSRELLLEYFKTPEGRRELRRMWR